MRIITLPRAEKVLRKLPKFDQIAVAQKIRNLESQINLASEERLRGYKDVYRVRIGDYRIVYKRSKDFLYIILIGHRKDVYEILKQLLS